MLSEDTSCTDKINAKLNKVTSHTHLCTSTSSMLDPPKGSLNNVQFAIARQSASECSSTKYDWSLNNGRENGIITSSFTRSMVLAKTQLPLATVDGGLLQLTWQASSGFGYVLMVE